MRCLHLVAHTGCQVKSNIKLIEDLLAGDIDDRFSLETQLKEQYRELQEFERKRSAPAIAHDDKENVPPST